MKMLTFKRINSVQNVGTDDDGNWCLIIGDYKVIHHEIKK